MLKSKSTEKQKSMGLHITRERLALLNKDINEPTYFDLEDLTDDEGNPAGTKVILKMQYKNLTGQIVDINNNSAIVGSFTY